MRSCTLASPTRDEYGHSFGSFFTHVRLGANHGEARPVCRRLAVPSSLQLGAGRTPRRRTPAQSLAACPKTPAVARRQQHSPVPEQLGLRLRTQPRQV